MIKNFNLKKIFIVVLFGLLQVCAFPQTKKNEEMVLVKRGSYTPFFIEENQKKKILVESFYLDKYQITNKEFLEFVKANPEWKKSNVKKIFADKSYLSGWKSDFDLGIINPQSPVINVSWFAAKAYAEWKDKRLPTSNEWEYAASASETNKDGTNDKKYLDKILGWYSKPSPKALPDVKSGEKNYWGVNSMHGVVWEWVDDFNSVLVNGESRGDTGLERNLFCGSASIRSIDPANYAAFMRYAFRSSLKANYTVGNLGFRCAKDYQINLLAKEIK